MYGQTSGALRAALTTLLRQQRIEQRFGDEGGPAIAAAATPTEREQALRLVGQYRQTVMVWCHQAVRATTPQVNLEGTSGHGRSPVEELRYRLAEAISGSAAPLPSLDELATEHPLAAVESWRGAARAAALGEHDFGAGIGYGDLSPAQCHTVLKDAADVTRALVALDHHYSDSADWESLKNRDQLARAAHVCAAFASYDEPDYAVDSYGWRPPITTIDGPALPGSTGLLQAEHNLLAQLGRFPNARNLRLVLDSQRLVSRDAAALVEANEPALAAAWRRRTSTYERLIRSTRDLGGLSGHGGAAAGHGAVAATRIEKLNPADLADQRTRRQLDRLFTHVDAKITQIVEHGAAERLYFVRVPHPRIDESAAGLTKPNRHRYAPITSPVQTDLLNLVRDELRPPPPPPRPPTRSTRSRTDFEAAIAQRPVLRGATLRGPSL